MSDYQILKEEVIASPKNKKHTLVDMTLRTPQGNEVVWQYVTVNNVVSIAALTEDHKIWLVRQWRPARKEFVWELPAGGIKESDPTPEQVIANANRELQEEIGLKAGKIEIVAACSPSIHLAGKYFAVIATGLQQSKLPEDEDESLEYRCVSLAEAEELLTQTQLPSAISLINLIKAQQYIQNAR